MNKTSELESAGRSDSYLQARISPGGDEGHRAPGKQRRWQAIAHRIRTGSGQARTLVIVAALAIGWEAAVRVIDVNPLLFPRFTDVLRSFLEGFGAFGGSGLYWSLTWVTLQTLLKSYTIAIASAIVLTSLAVGNKWGRDLLKTLTGIFQPLPGIALLPIAILWFGINDRAIIFVVVMTMLWPIAAGMSVGFATIPETLLRVGKNYQLSRSKMLWKLMLPMAMPAALSGARVGWGYGWRTVVGAELVFGTTGAQGGLGWYINRTRIFLDVPGSLSAILVVIVIGIATESGFSLIQRATTVKWGLERS